jgi:acetoacetyl-CoA synthetase
MSKKPLWTPSNPDQTLLADFMRKIGKGGLDYHTLWQWSCENMDDFWSAAWDYFNVIGDKGDRVFEPAKQMRDCKFFPDASLNYAENCLQRRDDGDAIIFWGEDKIKTRLSWAELYEAVSRFQQFLIEQGVGRGDRVAGFVANTPETVIAMLATASLGAIWSSASPDFGVQGVLDRFGQIEPKVMVAVNGYYYNGKTVNCMDKINEFLPQLPSVESCVIIEYADLSTSSFGLTKGSGKVAQDPPIKHVPDIDPVSGDDDPILWSDIQSNYPAKGIEYTRVPFDHPLVIMFSSGTTGIPKCIVHCQGGVLLTHLKEHQLQCDIRENDRIFYFTTCGWMMWNWQVTALASGATLCLYDGSPFAPDPNILWDYADAEGITLFGTAAKYIDALNKHGIHPCETHDLSTIRTMTSTGSPLVHESFDYIYRDIKADLHLASISGGTDIVSCFVIGNPISPVYRGEIQGAGLAYAMDALDENGDTVSKGVKGEFVCTRPFPAMPILFWNDDDGAKYHAAYFDRFDNIWCHGDFVEKTPSGGWIIHGRSDATLNPGGVRIGTAEIYRQVEKIPQVKESIAVGQQWDGDVRVILFVVMQDGEQLTDDICAAIKAQIKSGASPRHVPAKILQVEDIPRTKSGKITEIAVRDVIHGKAVHNTEALANPEALKFYKDRAELTA